MEPRKLYDGEYKFAQLVWEQEPINSTELVKLSLERLGWKKSTTYTVLKKLCQRGILRNDNATVTALVKQREVQRYESATVIDRTFGGSLPGFLTAFLSSRKVSRQEAEELKRIIEEATK